MQDTLTFPSTAIYVLFPEALVPLNVNGQEVEDGVLEAEFVQIKGYFERLGNVSCCERDDEFRGYARQNTIARVLLSQEGRKRIANVPAEEVDAALKELQAAHGGEQAFLLAIGATSDQLDLVRRDVEGDLRVRKMIDALCAAAGPASESDLLAYYNEHREQFMTAEEVRASHILKDPRRSEDRQAAAETLRAVRRQLLDGADFDELARQHSDKAADHIDLNFFKRGELPEELEMVAFSMNVGEISPVFMSTYGFHLLKLTDRREPTLRPFDEVRGEVLERFNGDRRQTVTRKLVEELQAKATIEDTTPAPAAERPAHDHVHV
jgi:hypothetical protein